MLLDLLTLKIIQSYFPSQYYTRGRKYYLDKKVQDIEIIDTDPENTIIFATVYGTDTYEVSIELKKMDKVIHFKDTCTCPMGRECKHVVATLLAALNSRNTPVKPSNVVPIAVKNDPAVDRWLSNMRGALASSQTNIAEKTEDIYHFFYLLSHKSSYAHNPTIDVQVTISFARVLKSGKIGVWKPFSIHSDSQKKYLDDNTKAILLQLKGMQGMYLTNNYYGGGYALSGPEGGAILLNILATGHCYWQKNSPPALTSAPEKTAEWHWIMDDKGYQTLHFLPDVTEQKAIILFTLDHTEQAWYCNTKTGDTGIIDTKITAKTLAFLLTLPKVPIGQAEKIADLLLQHKQKIPIQTPTLSGGDTLKKITPTPCLHLFQTNIMEAASAKNDWENTPRSRATAELFFDYDGLRVSEKNKESILHHTKNNQIMRIQRDTVKEAEAINALQTAGWQFIKQLPTVFYHNRTIPDYLLIDADPNHTDAPLNFTANILPNLITQGWKIDIDENYAYQIVTDDIDEWYSSIDDTSSYDWFGFELGITLKGVSINLLPVLQTLLKKLPANIADNAENKLNFIEKESAAVYAELPNGRYIQLPAERIKNILNIFIELYDNNSLTDENKLKLSKLHAIRLLELQKAMGAANLRWLGGERLRNMAEKLSQFQGIQITQPSVEFQGILRPYQIEGLSWLQFLREYELSGILADDMGLGKTVQALSHILLEKMSGRMKIPSLIIAPTSLMFNWQAEAERFAPNLKVLLLHGTERKNLYDDIIHHDLILTTYPLIVRDKEILLKEEFYFLVLDEAQCIKNAQTQAAQIAIQLKAKHRLCLTGTPMENHLGELWSLFHFMMPGLLGDQRQFTRLFRTPIEKHADQARRAHLNRRIAPFLLRRTKDKVIEELPEKVHIIRHVEIDGAQRDLYETIRVTMQKKVKQQIAQLGLNRSHIFILEALLKLRQVCCDPRLLKIPAVQKKQAKSAKLSLLMDLIKELLEDGRRILLFSQFTEMLGLIEAELTQTNIAYVKLTGQTKDRRTPVEQFQTGQIPLFLISLKAGGTGLNLTAADTVIHYDPWWNPAVENQATDRAHRIGQNKTVFVYKLVTKGTVEEKILDMQQHKRALMEGLFSDAEVSKLKLNEKDLSSLFDPLDTL